MILIVNIKVQKLNQVPIQIEECNVTEEKVTAHKYRPASLRLRMTWTVATHIVRTLINIFRYLRSVDVITM